MILSSVTVRVSLVLILFLSPLALSAETARAADGDALWTPSLSESYFRLLLFQANYSEAEYYRMSAVGEVDDVSAPSLASALEAWMILWQCYGYAPAAGKIRELASLDTRIARHVGFTPDLTVEADATLMKIENKRFDQYLIFLVRVANRHFEVLPVGEDAVRILDVDGIWWMPEVIDERHPLFHAVGKIASTYASEMSVAPGRTFTFKQVFATRLLTSDRIRLILVSTGRGTVEILFPENIEDSSVLLPIADE